MWPSSYGSNCACRISPYWVAPRGERARTLKLQTSRKVRPRKENSFLCLDRVSASRRVGSVSLAQVSHDYHGSDACASMAARTRSGALPLVPPGPQSADVCHDVLAKQVFSGHQASSMHEDRCTPSDKVWRCDLRLGPSLIFWVHTGCSKGHVLYLSNPM